MPKERKNQQLVGTLEQIHKPQFKEPHSYNSFSFFSCQSEFKKEEICKFAFLSRHHSRDLGELALG